MVKAFLVYFTAAGEEILRPLPLDCQNATYFLPNEPGTEQIVLTSEQDQQHLVCLEVRSSVVFLRVFGDCHDLCSVLCENGYEANIPTSTPDHQFSIILRPEEQFLTSGGRWTIRWDDEHGTLSNSMRPPPLPVLEGSEHFPISEEPLPETPPNGLQQAKEGEGMAEYSDETESPSPVPSTSHPENDIPNDPTLKEVQGQNKRRRPTGTEAISEEREDDAAKQDSEIHSDTAPAKRRKMQLEPKTPTSSGSLIQSKSTSGTIRNSARRSSILSTPNGGTVSQDVPASERQSSASACGSPRPYKGAPPVVIFSSKIKKTAMDKYGLLGGETTDQIIDANILCVPTGDLKKTYKLIMAVARGIDVVTTKWIEQSHRQNCFLAVEEFLPRDRSRERLWKFNLEEAIRRGKTGLTHLLTGTTVCFTTQFKKDMGELEREFDKIATTLGADVKGRLPAIKDKRKHNNHDTMIIGMPGDAQSQIVSKLGLRLFNKDILTMAVLRGEVERQSEEFLIKIAIKDEEE